MKLAYWSNIECDIPILRGSGDADDEGLRQDASIFSDFEAYLVKLYGAILEWQARSLYNRTEQNVISKFVLHVVEDNGFTFTLYPSLSAKEPS